MRNKLTLLILNIFLASSDLAFGYLPKPSIDEAQNYRLLFIQTAEEIIVKQNPKNPERWMVTLLNVSPDVSYFSEKPKKIAGKITIDNFLEEWKLGPKSNPNGSLVTQFSYSNLEGDGTKKLISLSNPRFDNRNRTITYDAQNPSGKNNLSEGRHAEPVLFIEKVIHNIATH